MTDQSHSPEPFSAGTKKDPGTLVLLILGSLIGVFFLYQAGGGALTYFILGDLSVTPENVGMFRTVTMVSQLLFILTPTLLVARWSGISFSTMFPLRLPSLLEGGLALLGLLAIQRVLETVLYLQSLLPIPEFVETILSPLKEMVKTMMMTLVQSDTPLEFVAVILVVAIVPSIVEEVFFRGLIQSLIEYVSKPIWSVVGSGLIFGLFHLNPFDAIGLIGLGIFLAYTRYRSASLLVPVMLHFANNGLAVVAVSAGLDNEELLIETMGQAPGLGVVLGQGALFAALLFVIVRAYQRVTENLHKEETHNGV
jgi:membrane protease YdiL (CAAX protease family)